MTTRQADDRNTVLPSDGGQKAVLILAVVVAFAVLAPPVLMKTDALRKCRQVINRLDGGDSAAAARWEYGPAPYWVCSEGKKCVRR